MAKTDYGRDMYRQLTEVMARLEKVEERSKESERKHGENRDTGFKGSAKRRDTTNQGRTSQRKGNTGERDNGIKRREYEAESRSSPIKEQ